MQAYWPLPNVMVTGTGTMSGGRSGLFARLKTLLDNGIVYVPVKNGKITGLSCWNYRFYQISVAADGTLVS